jgi:hypothetical protein
MELSSLGEDRDSSTRDGTDSGIRSVIDGVVSTSIASDFEALVSTNGFGDSLLFVSSRILFTTSGLGMLDATIMTK